MPCPLFRVGKTYPSQGKTDEMVVVLMRERERERGGGGGGGATMRVSKEVKESSILGDGNRICIKN